MCKLRNVKPRARPIPALAHLYVATSLGSVRIYNYDDARQLECNATF